MILLKTERVEKQEISQQIDMDSYQIELGESLEREDAAHIRKPIPNSNEIRLMILGEKGGGKTSFSRRFAKLDAVMPDVGESTEGINFCEPIELKDIDERIEIDVSIDIWDFAGRKADHALHKFFLAKEQCVYVVVCGSRQSESFLSSKIDYWLDLIRDYAKGKNQTVFVLINKWDDHKPYINKKSIEYNYPEFKLIYRYINIDKENQKNGKLDEFRRELTDFIMSVDTKVPACIKKILERMNLKFKETNYISIKNLENIIKEESDENYEEVLRILNTRYAYCFWYKDISGIDAVMLNPRWIAGAVYKIINWVQNREPNYKSASIKKSDFDKALRTSEADKLLFPETQDKFIFEALKHFELAYCENCNTLVIPDCLDDSYPDDEIGLKFDFEDSVQVEFCIQGEPDIPCPEFPREIIPLFTVKNYKSIYKNAKGNSVISHDRAMFDCRDGISRAEIKRLNDHRISIIVKGDNIDRNTTYIFEFVLCFYKNLCGYNRFQKQKPEVLYYATQANGKLCTISIRDLKAKSLKQIENYYGLEFEEEEFYRIGLVIANYIKNFKTYNGKH